MSNQLTGDFDAVAQVSAAAVNRLLASMHQNDADNISLPTLPHRVKLRVGDKPLPPAAAGVRGTIQAQIGTPTISLVAGTAREADLSCWTRVRYQADAGSAALPEFIHGRIVARFQVDTVTVAGTPSLRAMASSDDSHINFVDSGLTSGDLAKVNALLRYLLRTYVKAVLTLPAEVPAAAADFRVVTDAQNRTALALPITVNGNPPASGSFGDVFLESSAFAIAASRDLILSMLQPGIDALNQAHPGFTISRTIGWGPFSKTLKAHYTISMSAAASWKDGVLTFKIDGTAETPTWWAPNADFTITQSLTFSCDVNAQMVVIAPAGAPEVSVDVHGPFGGLVEGKAESKAKDQFIDARDNALPAAQAALNALLVQQMDRLRGLLQRIDQSADVRLASCAFTDPGALLRGTIKLSPRLAPRVEFSELSDGSGYTAYASWIPGGRIKEYKWTWWRNGDPPDPQTTGVVVQKTLLDDRFVLQQEKLPLLLPGEPPPEGPSSTPTIPAPSGDDDVLVATSGVQPILDPAGVVAPVWGQACLRVYGEHVDPSSGVMTSVSQEVKFDPALTCTFESGLGKIDLPSERPPKKPIHMGDPDPFQKGINTLVLTAPAGEATQSLRNIRDALVASDRLKAGLLIVVAAPIQNDAARRLADDVQQHFRGFPRVVGLVADRDSTWLARADLPREHERLAFRLIDSAGSLVWRHDGVLDSRTLAASLRTHLLPTAAWRPGLLRALVQTGDPAPDFLCESAREQVTTLRDFRGRRIALLFAPTGSDPLDLMPKSIRGTTRPDQQKPLIVAVQDGAAATSGAVGDSSFDYLSVADDGGHIGRIYGIRYRPTLVLVDRDFRITATRVISEGHVRT